MEEQLQHVVKNAAFNYSDRYHKPMKYMVITILVVLPFVGFYLGMKYDNARNNIRETEKNSNEQQLISPTIKATPTQVVINKITPTTEIKHQTVKANDLWIEVDKDGIGYSDFIIHNEPTSEIPISGGLPAISGTFWGLETREEYCTYYEDERDVVLEIYDQPTQKWEVANICPAQNKPIDESKLYCRQLFSEVGGFVYVSVYSSYDCPNPLPSGAYRFRSTVFQNCQIDRLDGKQYDGVSSSDRCAKKTEVTSDNIYVITVEG